MLAHRKIRDIQEKLRLLEKIPETDGPGRNIFCFMGNRPSTHCRKNTAGWRPMRENSIPEFNILITRIFDDINRCQLRLGAEASLLSFHRKAGTEQFLYVEVEVAGRDARRMKEIMRLPAASFLRHQAGKRHCGGARRFSGPFCAGI